MRPGNLGFVTDSPLFDEPEYGSNEWDIQQRAMAQRAMEAGRPLTVAEMHGGRPQQLFTTLHGLAAEEAQKELSWAKFLALIYGPVGVAVLGLFLMSRLANK